MHQLDQIVSELAGYFPSADVPLVSVVVATYNRPALLAETLAKNANVSSVFSSASSSNLCAIHNRQPTVTAIQDKIIELLASGHLARNGDSRYINTIAN